MTLTEEGEMRRFGLTEQKPSCMRGVGFPSGESSRGKNGKNKVMEGNKHVGMQCSVPPRGGRLMKGPLSQRGTSSCCC